MTRRAEVAAYLWRLGLDEELPPTLDTLVAVHRRHLDAVPYESLSTMLGRPPSVDPLASLERVAAVGRAGYCFHQNGALEVVLRELGFTVSRRHAHVHNTDADRGPTPLNHLALVVDGLPTDDHPAGRWWADVGLGDCFRDPVPVREGRFEQGGFRYEITEVRPDGWSFRADERGSFAGVEVSSLPVDQPAVEEAHRRLTTPPDGTFTRLVVVQRRGAASLDTVRGCLWTHVEPERTEQTELATYDEWRTALTDGLGLSLDGLDEAGLRALHDEQWARHVAWTAAGRP